MDPVLSSFILTISGIAIGGIVTLVASFGKCFRESRCTNIKMGCLSCDRSVLEVTDPVYSEKNEAQSPRIRL
jgi:hypothetical protein